MRTDSQVPLAHRRIGGLCGRAFALVKPPDEEELERHKLRADEVIDP